MTKKYMEGAIKTLTHERPRLLVAIENERDSRRMAEVASDLAGGLGASVTLLRVVPPPPNPWVWMSDGLMPGGGAYFVGLNAGEGPDLLEEMALAVDELEREAQAELRQLECSFAGLAVSHAVAIDANAGRAIVAWLRRCPHDLVVLADSRRHPLLRIFGPTTLDQIVRCGLASAVVATDAQGSLSAAATNRPHEQDGSQLTRQRSRLRA